MQNYFRILLYLQFFLLFFLMWIILSIQYNALFVLFGFFSTLIILKISLNFDVFGNFSKIFTFSFFAYVKNLITSVIKSSIQMLIYLLQEKIEIYSKIENIHFPNLTKEQKVLLANFITMTPGTFVISIKGDDFLIHCVDKDSMENIKNINLSQFFQK